MRNLRRVPLVILIFFVLYRIALLLDVENPVSPVAPITFSGDALGTTYTVKLATGTSSAGLQGEAARRLITLRLESVNEKMSTWLEDSELSQFNEHGADEPFSFSPETMKVFNAAQDVSEASGGAFDITVGPIVNLWGFGPGPRQEGLPTDDAIEETRERIGYQRITIDAEASTITKSDVDLYCDLSAIAKGFAVDAIARAMEDRSFRNYMVEVGGEVRTSGHNARGEPWQMAIEKPAAFASAIQRIVPLTNQAMATSGNYRNFYESEGTRYSHTIDPTTGRPVTHNTVSVTVLHDECMYADAWATALLVLGYEEGRAVADREGLAVLWIEESPSGEFEEHMSPAFRTYLIKQSLQETAI